MIIFLLAAKSINSIPFSFVVLCRLSAYFPHNFLLLSHFCIHVPDDYFNVVILTLHNFIFLTDVRWALFCENLCDRFLNDCTYYTELDLPHTQVSDVTDQELVSLSGRLGPTCMLNLACKFRLNFLPVI